MFNFEKLSGDVGSVLCKNPNYDDSMDKNLAGRIGFSPEREVPFVCHTSLCRCVTDRTILAIFVLYVNTAREKDTMTRRQYFRKLTHREQLKFEQILTEQLEVQRWALVIFVNAMQSDVLITLN